MLNTALPVSLGLVSEQLRLYLRLKTTATTGETRRHLDPTERLLDMVEPGPSNRPITRKLRACDTVLSEQRRKFFQWLHLAFSAVFCPICILANTVVAVIAFVEGRLE